MYYIKQNPGDPRKLEVRKPCHYLSSSVTRTYGEGNPLCHLSLSLAQMSFDCSNFQYQLKEQNLSFKDHIFQVRSQSP